MEMTFLTICASESGDVSYSSKQIVINPMPCTFRNAESISTWLVVANCSMCPYIYAYIYSHIYIYIYDGSKRKISGGPRRACSSMLGQIPNCCSICLNEENQTSDKAACGFTFH